jgi:hypothetical protein
MKKSKIPADWLPWIEIAQDSGEVHNIIQELECINPEVAELVAYCCSAAKWITGNPEELGIFTSSNCGICWIANSCVDCVLKDEEDIDCIDRARRGDSMRLYTKAYRAWTKKEEGRVKR